MLQKPSLLAGISRTYQPKDEEGEQLPPEFTRVQASAKTWTDDPSADCYVTQAVQTAKTKKVPRNHVKAEATDKHPAQVETYMEDIIVGYWKTVKFSGALPASRIKELLDRVDKLQQVVKFAREAANAIEAPDRRVGESLFSYLFSRFRDDRANLCLAKAVAERHGGREAHKPLRREW